MRNTPIRRSIKRIPPESEKHRLKRLAEQSKPLSERPRKGFSTISAPRKAIKKVNPERQAKRRKSYAQKLAAYKRSETYKIVVARADGMCERRIVLPSGWDAQRMDVRTRCWNTKDLQHHHKTYARFGGKELPGDIEVLCKMCHAEAESQHPTRSRKYSGRAHGGESA